VPVEGIEELAQLARELKAGGNKEMTKELRQGLQRSIRPLREAARQGALDQLPSAGGLAAEVARSGFSGKVSLLGRNPSVKITGKGKTNEKGLQHDLRAMDRGRLRHPTWGGGRWVTQLITPGWFSLTLEAKADRVKVELFKAADAVIAKLGRPG
jgi:hypothetical protein